MKKTTALITLALFSVSPILSAAQHTVKLLTSGNNGAMMVMEPGFLKIEAGDSVTFEPADPSHNAVSLSIPEGAEAFSTPFGKTQTISFNTQGVYVYKCAPHLPLGMVGVIQVGKAANLAQTKTNIAAVLPQIAMNKNRLEQYLAQVK